MQKKVNVRALTMTAILGAVATVLMFFSFSIPVILPQLPGHGFFRAACL